jgi:hypothetical protein
MDLLRMAGDAWKEADKRLGGWLPGGGTASPVTAASQRAQRDYNEKIRRRIEMRDAPAGTPGRFAGEGPVLNALRATTSAGANPIGVALGDEKEVEKVASYYGARPQLQWVGSCIRIFKNKRSCSKILSIVNSRSALPITPHT